MREKEDPCARVLSVEGFLAIMGRFPLGKRFIPEVREASLRRVEGGNGRTDVKNCQQPVRNGGSCSVMSRLVHTGRLEGGVYTMVSREEVPWVGIPSPTVKRVVLRGLSAPHSSLFYWVLRGLSAPHSSLIHGPERALCASSLTVSQVLRGLSAPHCLPSSRS